jgi:hypothetical protein
MKEWRTVSKEAAQNWTIEWGADLTEDADTITRLTRNEEKKDKVVQEDEHLHQHWHCEGSIRY